MRCKFSLFLFRKNNSHDIYIRVTSCNNRYRYFSGYKIYNDSPDNITKVSGVLKVSYNRLPSNLSLIQGNTVRKWSEVCAMFYKAERNIVSFFDTIRVLPSKAEVNNILDEAFKKALKNEYTDNDKFWKLYEQFYIDHKLSHNSIKRHKTAESHLREFEGEVGEITFSRIDHGFLKKYERYLYNGERGDSAVNVNMVSLRTVIRYMTDVISKDIKEPVLCPFNGFKIVKAHAHRHISLYLEELNTLLGTKLRPVQAKVRDVFIIQCLTGCRVGDLFALTKKDNIHNGFLIYCPQKTKGSTAMDVRVPLTQEARTLIDKYDELTVVPFIAQNYYNMVIKDVCRIAGLNRLVPVVDTLTGEEKNVPLYEAVTSHVARKTFISLMYAKNVKNEVIASMSGHTETSTAFMAYRKVEDEQKIEAVKNLELIK